MSEKDDTMSSMVKAMLISAFQGESQIQESIRWDSESKVTIHVKQAAWAAVGAVLVYTGIRIVILVLAGARHGLMFEIALTAGMASILFGCLLSYRFVKDVIDPLGKLSALERMFKPYIKGILGLEADEPEPEGPSRRIPLTKSGKTTALDPDQNRPGLHHEDQELVEFLALAGQIGFTQARWLLNGKAKYTFSTGTRCTRTKWETLLDEAENWGLIRLNGKGSTADWLMNVHEAIDVIYDA